jgi:hypothetical protein
MELLTKFAERNNFKIVRKLSRGRNRIRLVRKQIPIHFISGSDTPDFKFLDIADLHIGNPTFDENLLRSKLQYAVDNDIKLVFIAGDVFEGVQSENEDAHFCEQLSRAFNIFKDYPLTYHAINGNHDYSFEQIDLPNPIKTLASRLKAVGIDFNYYDCYLMDFVICGVIKRVMHVERADYNLKRVFSILKLRHFEYECNNYNVWDGNVIPIRFFEVGHIHMNIQIYYAKRKVFISHPGSFIRDYSDDDDCCNVITGRIIDQKVFMT